MAVFDKRDFFQAVVALVLAVTTYYFVSDARKAKEIKTVDPSYKLIKLTAKTVPIKVRIASNAPQGYQLIQEKVTVTPERVVVIGPEALLEEAASAETAILDISQSTRKFQRNIPLESISGIHLGGQPYSVEVTVPIEKIEIK